MDTVQKAGIAIIIFGLITICLGFRRCNPDNGPSGVYDCVPLKGYDLPQYATCLTNAYAEMKTNYRYACGKNLYGIRPTYCWYQCMVELHDMDNGQVKNDCACNLGQHVTKYPGYISTTQSPIPGRCHTPTGYDCLWFSTCLNSKYSCHGRDYKEVIELGSNFCNFASKTKKDFRKWFFMLYQKTDKNQGKQMKKFANAFEDGEFQENLIQLDKMFVCKDIHCEDTYLHRNASYPEQTKPRKHEEKKNSHVGIMGIGIGVFVGIFVVAVCVMCLARWVRLNRPRDIRHFILTED
ncbi:unnamed protein product [Mytilus edulis]|uniref:Uncharacterized protein n=1 Tax=Mytilus edulis TaxID=6550 RepID=A0A8S3SS47_MYTED|nr:unnamed protein product [Mytilus edulis]